MDTAITTDEITVVEHSRISPFPNINGSSSLKSYPLSYLDIPWIHTHPSHMLFFHDLPHPKSHLLHTIIPNLKHSFSVTLQHFRTLAGNLIIFPFTNPSCIPTKPEIRYMEGNSVSFIVTESSADFVYLTTSHPKKANQLHPLVPKLGDVTRNNSDGTIQVPLLALQVTLFPNHGICIGITSHHTVGDASSFLNFIKAWASITKFGNDKHFLSTECLPVFDKSLINDSSCMDAMIWGHIAKTQYQDQDFTPKHLNSDTVNDDTVRASFYMTKDQINSIKKLTLEQRPTITRVSSFTIVCAHVWNCLTKARDAVGVTKEPKLVFGCLAECRTRLDPPLPTTYFGNCLVPFFAIAKHDEIAGDQGFFNGVQVIGDAIHERLKSKESIDSGTKIWMGEKNRVFPTTVAGSPKFNFYDTDFGWGKPKKCEFVSIDYSSAIFLNPSRDSEQDLEIVLSLPKIQMDAFQAIFKENTFKNHTTL